MPSRGINIVIAVATAAVLSSGTSTLVLAEDDIAVFQACHEVVKKLAVELPHLATVRTDRFLGKGSEAYARCNGGDAAGAPMGGPRGGLENHWGAGGARAEAHKTLGLPVLGVPPPKPK